MGSGLEERTVNNRKYGDYPQISIIVAVKNGCKVMEKCLKKAIKQTYPHKEIIIIDGGSTDGTLQIIRNYQHAIAYWESNPDRGIYHAWNKALGYARGDWICFLGADDYFWNKKILENLAPDLIRASQSGIKVVYGRMARVSDSGRTLKEIGKPWKKIRWQMRHGMPLPHPGLMHHRSLFETHGNFDETFRIAGDYEFLLRELKNGSALFVDLLSIGNQIGGIADVNSPLTSREVLRARKKNGLGGVTWLWMLVYIRSIIRSYWRKSNRKSHYV
jgi:glycosyltransferase involved in cell wall biosynthesis